MLYVLIGIPLVLLLVIFIAIVAIVAHESDAMLYYKKHGNFDGFFFTFDTKNK